MLNAKSSYTDQTLKLIRESFFSDRDSADKNDGTIDDNELSDR